MKNIKLIVVFLFCFQTLGFGQMNNYKFMRPITELADSMQWQRIDLPLDIYNKTKSNLSDIRIYQVLSKTDTLECPYIFDASINKSKSYEVEFHLLNQSKRSIGPSYTFHLQDKKIINEIFLDFDNLNFDWKVILEGSTDQKSWSTILDDYRILAIKGPNGDYRFTSLYFPKSNFEYYRVTIKSKDDVKFGKATFHFEKSEHNRYSEVPINSQLIEPDKKNKESIIKISLAEVFQVDQIQLNVNSKGDYYRPINITVLHDSTLIDKKWNYHYRSLYQGTLSSLQDARFDFDDGFGKTFRITIENHDNPMLDLGTVTLRNRTQSIYSKLTKKDQLFLCYGNGDASFPNYDLKYFKDDIELHGNPIKLGTETHRTVSKDNIEKPLFDNKLWLWALLFFLVAGMGWVSLKMLRNDSIIK